MGLTRTVQCGGYRTAPPVSRLAQLPGVDRHAVGTTSLRFQRRFQPRFQHASGLCWEIFRHHAEALIFGIAWDALVLPETSHYVGRVGAHCTTRPQMRQNTVLTRGPVESPAPVRSPQVCDTRQTIQQHRARPRITPQGRWPVITVASASSSSSVTATRRRRRHHPRSAALTPLHPPPSHHRRQPPSGPTHSWMVVTATTVATAALPLVPTHR